MLTVAIPKRNKLQNIIVLTPKDGSISPLKKLRKRAVCICRRLFLLQSSLAFQAMFFYNKTY